MKQLILGGARSGKSRLAEQLASNTNKRVVYIATADCRQNDQEMDQRIASHQQNRPEHWQTVESSKQLAAVITEHADDSTCLLVDCLTLWLTNCLCSEPEDCWSEEKQSVLSILAGLPGDIIFVSNEVGQGIVPLGELNRRFVDESGFLHQAIAAIADRVIFTAAGLPLVMKGDALDG